MTLPKWFLRGLCKWVMWPSKKGNWWDPQMTFIGPTDDFHGTHNGPKLTKMVDFDRYGWTHITQKKAMMGDPQWVQITKKGNFWWELLCFGKIKLLFWEISIYGRFFPQKFPKKIILMASICSSKFILESNFKKNDCGNYLPKKEILMACIRASKTILQQIFFFWKISHQCRWPSSLWTSITT